MFYGMRSSRSILLSNGVLIYVQAVSIEGGDLINPASTVYMAGSYAELRAVQATRTWLAAEASTAHAYAECNAMSWVRHTGP